MEANRTIRQFLEKTLRENRIAHAYLFLGEEGLGKKEVALWYERQLNPQDKNFRPNLLLVEKTEGKGIKVDQIKEIKKWLRLSTAGKYRVVIINPAEEMNSEGRGALLKTLEEPSPKSVLILIASQIRNLPKTILSRCQILKFRRASLAEVSHWLKEEKERFALAVAEIFFLSEGKVERIKSWLKNPQLLRAEKGFFQQVERVLNGNLLEQLAWVEKQKKETDLGKFLEVALELGQHAILEKAQVLQQDSSFSALRNSSWEKLVRELEALQGTKHILETTNVNKKLALNQLFINF